MAKSPEQMRLEIQRKNHETLAAELEKRPDRAAADEAKRQRQLASGVSKELSHLKGKDPGKPRS